MWDVKVLIRTLYNVQLIVGLYAVLFIAAGLAIAPRLFPRTLMRLIAWGSGLTLAIVFITGLLSLTGFSQTFYFFHVIAFTNDLWKLDPARDYLIMMFPEGFFFDATMVLAALTVIQGLWIFCLAMSALKHLSASMFFILTVVQTLCAVVAAAFIHLVFPEGFFFEAVMIVVVASVAQALVALVAWRRAPSKTTSASASKNGEGLASRSTSSSRRSQEKSEQQQGSERTESLADNAILGYYVIEAVLLLLIPVIHEWRNARRVET